MHDRKGKDWKGQAALPIDQKQKTIGIKKNELEKCKYQRTGFKRYLWWKIHFILPDKVSFKLDKFPKMG